MIKYLGGTSLLNQISWERYCSAGSGTVVFKLSHQEDNYLYP